jgi:hypothetical protein
MPARRVVDVAEPDAKVRATRLLDAIGDVVEDLDTGGTHGSRANVKRFLLHVAWHEGDRATKRVQLGGGPGRSFFQFEADLATDSVPYAKQKGWIDRLVGSSNFTEAQLLADATANVDHAWPFGSVIERTLGDGADTSDPFAIHLARIAFKRVPDSIPAGSVAHATYWADHWKRSFTSRSDRESKIAQFIANSQSVDALV